MISLRALTTVGLALSVAVVVSDAQSTTVESRSTEWAAVTYLSGQNVYIDAGTARGLREGSRLAVVRAGSVVANLVVAFVSSTRASCTVESASVSIVVGDSARFVPTLTTGDPVRVAAAPSRVTTSRARPLHGRLGVRYLSITTRGSGSDILQPAVDARVEGPLGGPVGVLLDVRAHRTRLTGPSAQASPGETRVYQAAVQVQGQGNPGRLMLGRQFASAVSPIGLFDGMAADLTFPHWGIGALAGTQPDPVRFAYSSLIREYGAWLQVHNAPGTRGIWSFTTAAVGSYQGGEVNREFVYAQGVLVTRRLSVFASQELDINRDWKTDAGEPSTSLTSTFATARVSPVDGFALSGGFDNRRNVRLYRDWINPEVEFDDSFRRGVWGGADLTIARHVSLAGDVRSSEGGPAGRASSGSISLGLLRLTRFQLGFRTRATTYSGESLEGWLRTASFEVRPVSPLRLELTGGERRDANQLAGVTNERLRWFGGDVDLALGRSFYIMMSTQYETRGSERGRHSYAALSWRF